MPHRTLFRHASAASLALALAPAAVLAQDNHISFELGGGLNFSPAYEGSDEYKSGPSFQGGLNSLSLGGLSVGGDGESYGLSFAPSFGFVSKRDSSEYSELKGIDDVEWTVEVGLSVGYTWDYAEVSAAVRRGFNGHEGIVGDLAANAILRPGPDTTLRFGPRATFANDEYAETYFSVPSSAANLSKYSAEGGLKSVGIELIARQELSDTWAIEGKLGWERLMGDFEDSPITRAGSRDQASVGVSLIRQFDWRF
ncbi:MULTISPECIES: MipA/OmpV family protein [unclassified Marinovum]